MDLCPRPAGSSLVQVTQRGLVRAGAVWRGAWLEKQKPVASRMGKAHGGPHARCRPTAVLGARTSASFCDACPPAPHAQPAVAPAGWPTLGTGHIAQFLECTQLGLSRWHFFSLDGTRCMFALVGVSGLGLHQHARSGAAHPGTDRAIATFGHAPPGRAERVHQPLVLALPFHSKIRK